MIYEVMVGLNKKPDELYELSKDINECGFKSYVKKLPRDVYTVYVMMTRDREKAESAKTLIEMKFKRNVGIKVNDDDV